MLQKLMLAVSMTFALSLLSGISPPANSQTGFSAKVDVAPILKVAIATLDRIIW